MAFKLKSRDSILISKHKPMSPEGFPTRNKAEEIDKAASQEKPEVESQEVEQYEGLDMLFLDENLKENFDAVKAQLDSLRGLILQFHEIKEKQKIDPDQGQYLDECLGRIEDGFEHFTINNKEVDIGALAGEGAWEDKYNAIVDEVNRYKELSMIGSDARDLEGI